MKQLQQQQQQQQQQRQQGNKRAIILPWSQPSKDRRLFHLKLWSIYRVF
jgi:hypothetical protein